MTTEIGRPTKLTPELQTTICQFIREGNYISTACEAVGIWPTTYNDWLKRGETDTEGIYNDFYYCVKKAEAEAEAQLVREARAHSKRNVVAPLALLDRRFRKHWGQTPQPINLGDTKVVQITRITINQASPKQLDEPIEGEFKQLE